MDDPKLVMIVGVIGLVINVIGLFMFGGGHGHSHGVDDGGAHGHAHGQGVQKGTSKAMFRFLYSDV